MLEPNFLPEGHGMGLVPEIKAWPSLNAVDVLRLQAEYAALQGSAQLIWHSPRPFSSASIVATKHGEFLIKRSHGSYRSVADLLQEHQFIQHLSKAGIAVAKLFSNQQGCTVTAMGSWVYEVFARAQGQDIYAQTHSWKPFFDPQHAYTTGVQQAALHHAAQSFTAPARNTDYLIANQKIIEAVDPIAALFQRIHCSASLSKYFAARPLPQHFLQQMLRHQQPIQAALAQSPKIWTHNDLHASNLIWSDASPQAQITAVIDFGLSDLTTAAYDLAVSIERNFIDWLALAQGQNVAIDWAGLAQFLRAYAEHCSDRKVLALAQQILPLVHIDFALYELVYFLEISANPSHADAAYDYLVEHLYWFESAAGSKLLRYLERWMQTECWS